jgi:hypothetical protein
MTRKITLTISQDGTNNNKSRDLPLGHHTNVARIHQMQQVDYKFDFSKNASNVTGDPQQIGIEKEGDHTAFNTFLESDGFFSSSDSVSMGIYLAGVGSGQ